MMCGTGYRPAVTQLETREMANNKSVNFTEVSVSNGERGGGGSGSSGSAFLTEVKNQDERQQKNKVQDDELQQKKLKIKVEYAKLQDVVQHFAKKVDLLVDKQRHEYLQAYEHHMSDVQRELFNLREKATAIANDTTREEKIKKLDTDQKWFRNEAMRLDVETNEYRKKMRSIKVTIQSTERERDWLLDKLRAAKDKYKKLKTVRTELFERYGNTLDGGFSVVSSDSSYTLELQQHQSLMAQGTNRTGNWREQLQRDYLVTRGEVESGKKKQKNDKDMKKNSNIIHLQPLKHSSHYPVPTKREEEERKELISSLVKERAKSDGIRDFIGQCYNCAAVGAWSKHRRRDLADILQDCHDLLSDIHDGHQEQIILQRRQNLILELVNYAEVYDILNQFLTPSPSSPHHRNRESNSDSVSGGHDQRVASLPEFNLPHLQEDEVAITSAGNEGNDDQNYLTLSDDVLKYFEEEKSRRQEMELDEKSRKLFG